MFAMASDPRARQVWVRWEVDGFHGGLRIAVGTLEYLGIKGDVMQVGEIDVKKPSGTVTRRLYPGGPTISYQGGGGMTKRIMGGRVSTCQSGDWMYLRGGSGTTDTIRVTGSKRAFAKWIKANCSMGANFDTITLHNHNGTTYAVVHEPPRLPGTMTAVPA